jgi:hypothetical protein
MQSADKTGSIPGWTFQEGWFICFESLYEALVDGVSFKFIDTLPSFD